MYQTVGTTAHDSEQLSVQDVEVPNQVLNRMQRGAWVTRGLTRLEASVFGFRGWQVNPNLIFGDGEMRLRPQMEVWLLPRSLTLWGKNALRIWKFPGA